MVTVVVELADEVAPAPAARNVLQKGDASAL